MKNGTHPLYTLLRDPKPIATGGSAKKRASSLRKKILLGSLIALALGVGIWQLGEYQKSQRREQFITWVAKYRPNWSPSMIRAQWDKIQYAKQHAEIAAPAPSPVAWHVEPSAVPIPTTPPGRATYFGLTPDELKESPKPADIPGGYWVESDNPKIGWHWIKGTPSKSGRFANQ